MFSEINETKVSVYELKLGMYVSKLDIPWSATDFPLQGFLIETKEQILELCTLSEWVFVDNKKSKSIELSLVDATPSRQFAHMNNMLRDKQEQYDAASKTKNKRASDNLDKRFALRLSNIQTAEYAVTKSFHKAVRDAFERFEQSSFELATIAQGPHLDSASTVNEIRELSHFCIDSVLANPSAMAWLTKLKRSNLDIFQRAINEAVITLVFMREMKIERSKMEIVAFVILMKTIGITKLSKKTIALYDPREPSLDYLSYIEHTYIALKRFPKVPGSVVRTLENLGERYDGLGYPFGKQQDQIPLLSQIIIVATYYHDLINPVNNSRAISPSQAIAELQISANKRFDENLVNVFVRAVGLFPVGTLVELSDGSQAIVMSENPSHRFRALVCIIFDENGLDLLKPKMVDLAKNNNLVIRKSKSNVDISQRDLERCHEALIQYKSPLGKLKQLGRKLSRKAS